MIAYQRYDLCRCTLAQPPHELNNSSGIGSPVYVITEEDDRVLSCRLRQARP